MASAAYPQTGYRPNASPRDRGAALALALGITVALILLLVRLGAIPLPGAPMRGALTTFTFRGETPEPKRAVEKPHARRSAAQAAPKAKPLVQTTTSLVPVPNWTQTSSAELAALDTAMTSPPKIKPKPDPEKEDANIKDSEIGDRIALADWLRLPTAAEIEPYINQVHARIGWGQILCKSAPRNRVVDCHEYGESEGSGLSRALLEASWQFQVLPPRVNGHQIIGAPIIVYWKNTKIK